MKTRVAIALPQPLTALPIHSVVQRMGTELRALGAEVEFFTDAPDAASPDEFHYLRIGERHETRPFNQAIYPVGRYRYEDTAGIINGKLYFYAVTAFGVTQITNAVTGQLEDIELSGLPSAVEAEAIVPRWDAQSSCDQVKVVPNPYRGGAAWDLNPSERDPTGTKIAFRDLPQAISTIRIYTLAGDLIQEVEHDGQDGDGTFYWNMITRNGQNIVSGVYLYSVEYSGGVCRGRFVIIR